MSQFIGEIVVHVTPEGGWETYLPVVYQYGSDEDYETITVPEGYQTDFASVPRIFWNILPPYGKYTGAAVVHDWLYGNRLFNRKKCDDIFLDAMKTLGVGWWTRGTMYNAVRTFGWMFY